MKRSFPSLNKDEYRALLLIEEHGSIIQDGEGENGVDRTVILALVDLKLVRRIEPNCPEFVSTDEAEVFYEKYYERERRKHRKDPYVRG